MKINRVHLMSDREIKEIISTLEFSIQRINLDDKESAIWGLEKILQYANKTLKESKL